MKQLELDLVIRGDSKFDDIPSLEEMIERKRNRPKHLENLSDKHYQLMKEIFKGKF